MLDEHNDLVGITPLVVVPGNQLYKVAVKSNAGLGIENGGAGIAGEVGGKPPYPRYSPECPSFRSRLPS